MSLSLSLTNGMGLKRGGASPLAVPSGFDWAPPVSIYRSEGGVYSTDFNADDWKIDASVDIYVSTTGNDTTGDGSSGNPYRGIRKALQVAAAGADVGYNIYIEAGEYGFTSGFYGQACDRNLNIIATGGRVLATNKFPVTSWTADGAGTYKATRAAVVDVRDNRYPVTWPNGEQTPELLTSVADVATCQATASSWYSDGTTVWVHLQDGRSPDAGTGEDVGIILSTNNLLMSSNRSWFVQGIDFENSNATIVGARAGVGVAITRLVLDDCTARFQKLVTDRAFRLDGVATAILNNCRSYVSEGDGFGYSRRDSSSPSCYAMEIDCHAYSCGSAATTTNVQNGSTNHAAGRTIRVNCVYQDTYGPVVADINDTKNWCLNVDAQNCLLGTSDSQDSCFQAGDTTGGTVETWLDSCTTGGAFYDLYAGAGCSIHYRNMTAPTSTGGSGTIDTY